jgi:phytol kinase
MPMTWGDALAAVVGRRVGRRHYTVLGSTRSVEGSMTMFLAGWVATSVALMLLGMGDPMTALWVSAVTAFLAAIIEAVSPWGTDNLTVPAVSALILALMLA